MDGWRSSGKTTLAPAICPIPTLTSARVAASAVIKEATRRTKPGETWFPTCKAESLSQETKTPFLAEYCSVDAGAPGAFGPLWFVSVSIRAKKSASDWGSLLSVLASARNFPITTSAPSPITREEDCAKLLSTIREGIILTAKSLATTRDSALCLPASLKNALKSIFPSFIKSCALLIEVRQAL